MSTFRFLARVLPILTLPFQPVLAQPAAGKITYEVIQKIDWSQMRRQSNGQEPRPGGDAPSDLPDTRSFTQRLLFAGNYGKEERDRPEGMMGQFRRDGAGGPGGSGGDGDQGGAPAGPRPDFKRPFEQHTYLDLSARKTIEVLEIKKDSATKIYQAELPAKSATGWQEAGKTKKIAGYTCHKATATRRNEPYTIWYTTDLPFTYSPVSELTPGKGVVLQIESDNESFKATKVAAQSVPENTVRPPQTAQTVTPDEMNAMRRKVMADFRQQMMNRYQNR